MGKSTENMEKWWEFPFLIKGKLRNAAKKNLLKCKKIIIAVQIDEKISSEDQKISRDHFHLFQNLQNWKGKAFGVSLSWTI